MNRRNIIIFNSISSNKNLQVVARAKRVVKSSRFFECFFYTVDGIVQDIFKRNKHKQKCFECNRYKCLPKSNCLPF